MATSPTPNADTNAQPQPLFTPALAPATTPEQTPRPSAASHLYGSAFLGMDEVMDLLDQAGEQPGAKMNITLVDDSGRSMPIGSIPVGNFDYQQMIERYGGGTYNIRIQLPGSRSPWRAFKFKTANPINSMPRVAAPILAAGTPGAPPQDMMGLAITLLSATMQQQQAMMQAAMQQQSNMMQAVMQQKNEPRGMSDLEGIMKLAERISDRGGSDSDSGMGGMGSIIGQALAAVLAAPAGRPAAMPMQPPHPQMIAQPLKALPPAEARPQAPALMAANQDVNEREAVALDATPPAPLPVPDPVATQMQQRFAAVGAYLSLIVLNDNRDATRAADTVADLLGDETVDQIIDLPVGLVVGQIIAANPATEPHKEFLDQVEAALRDLYQDTPAAVAPIIVDATPETQP